MPAWWDKLKELLGGEEPVADQAGLSEEFKARYLSFRKLLAANNKALELMADMEAAAAGGRVYGMSFVRSRATALGVSVFTMAAQLERLAPGKYPALLPRLKQIQGKLEDILAPTARPGGDELVLPLAGLDQTRADEAGAKMANLGEMRNRLGLTVPPGFVITAAAWRLLLEHSGLGAEISRLQQAADMENAAELFTLSSRLRQLITSAPLPPELERALAQAYAQLAAEAGGPVRVSLRSSAIGEDSAEASFAGQYATQLNVAPEFLASTYLEVAASFFNPQAMHYRLMRGLRDDQLAMAVGCLAMVGGVSGGVAYSVSPLDPADRRVHLTAAWGLPRVVVDGEAAGDHFVLSREEPLTVISRTVEDKESELVCLADEGICRLELTGERAQEPCLSDEQARAVARAALRLEAHYGTPQDVEWAFDQQGRLVLLQCRPLRPADGGAAPMASATDGGASRPEALLRGGVVASLGAGAGPLHWVNREADALTFAPGVVLALERPSPRWAALAGRAAAVVSARGGAAGHLATVCREYGVPALFGLGPQLAELVDGDTVTVDASGRAIYPGRVEDLQGKAAPRPGLLAGSPVERLLSRSLEIIAPLTLLDPDSPDFDPAKAQTLHDVTRFCHEKSVVEMFAFGQEHRFPRRAAKQLHYQVPMQWWVLDLDDGFSHEISGKYVKLEDIACAPMLAVWDGMTIIPWEGPPAVSGRGLASVLFEATANPNLATGVKTRYANRNYFMIARHFMNLQSRFGFHFCAVEALAGPRRRENYLSFSFKGGAADSARRLARVRFVGEILQNRGFAVEMSEDNLRARVERATAEDILDGVKVVGYLLMHTRQLDMVMADPRRVAYYRQKIEDDLNRLESGEAAKA
ncbi:MAG: hypothetical protein KQH53_10265 [Desulfarculaceae bacterium]|nr:hypothetical protein [Desulfarculaceae bacterium]